MSASGNPITLNSGKYTRVAETDTLYVGVVQPNTTDLDLLVLANGTGELKLGTVGRITRVLGDLAVDGAETVTGGATFNGNVTLGDNSGDSISIGGGSSDSASLKCDLSVLVAIDVRFERVTGTGVLVLPSSSVGETGAIRIDGSNDLQWWNGASWSTAAASTWDLDDGYNNGATITVDAYDTIWNLTGDYSFTVDLSAIPGTGADGFQVLNGTDHAKFLRGGANDLSVDIDASTINLDTSAGIALNAAAASTWTTVNTNLTLTATLAGVITLNGVGGVTINGNANSVDVDGIDIALDATSASNFTVSGAAADLTLGARAATITLNEAGDTSLSGFTATSIIGGLNELKGEITDVGVWSDTADEAITQYDIVSADDGSATGKIVKANKDTANQNFVVGVAQTGVAGGASVSIKSSGKSTVLTSDVGAWTVGQVVYMSGTDGEVTSTAPTSGESQRVGYSLDTGSGSSRTIVIVLGEPVSL